MMSNSNNSSSEDKSYMPGDTVDRVIPEWYQKMMYITSRQGHPLTNQNFKNILDYNYDLKPILLDCYDRGLRELDEIVDAIFEKYPELEGISSAIRGWSRYEFMEYMKDRYCASFRKVEKYYMEMD